MKRLKESDKKIPGLKSRHNNKVKPRSRKAWNGSMIGFFQVRNPEMVKAYREKRGEL